MVVWRGEARAEDVWNEPSSGLLGSGLAMQLLRAADVLITAV